MNSCVSTNNVRSTFLTIETGDSLRALSGTHTLQPLYNDLPDICPDIGLQMYADDTVVYASGNTVLLSTDKTKCPTLDKSITPAVLHPCLTLNTKKQTQFALLH